MMDKTTEIGCISCGWTGLFADVRDMGDHTVCPECWDTTLREAHSLVPHVFMIFHRVGTFEFCTSMGGGVNFPDEYRFIGTVECRLDESFEICNAPFSHEPWYTDSRVTLAANVPGARTMCTGDLLKPVDAAELYEVQSFGYGEVEIRV